MRLSDLALNLLDLLDAELAMSHKRRVFWARGEFSKARYIENNVLPHYEADPTLRFASGGVSSIT